MGKLLGAHASDELDRPDLNKCPDCLCFFAGDNCPLCGKECPEEMRAGNRAKVKPKKKKINPNAGRVTFIPWYHSWLFIILMMFVMPIIGIILLCTSPYRTRTKIIVVASIVGAILLFVLVIVPMIMYGEMYLFLISSSLLDSDTPPVDTSLPQDQYMNACEAVSPENFYRNPNQYDGKFVKMTLTVKQIVTDYVGDANGDDNTTYYICEVSAGIRIMVRDCSLDGDKNFLAGDIITIYGEGAGNKKIYDYTEGNDYYTTIHLPCLNGAYIFLE